MTKAEKWKECSNFFKRLTTLLKDDYDVMGSFNVDQTLYLVPKGTEDQVTYHSKPAYSFRLSDHWNWYANIKKCSNERYIQCWAYDLPRPRKRKGPGLASEPIEAICVAMTRPNGSYKVIFGDHYTKRNWIWIENNAYDIYEKIMENLEVEE